MIKKIHCESCNKLIAEVTVEADITATQHFSNPVGKIINCGRCSALVAHGADESDESDDGDEPDGDGAKRNGEGQAYASDDELHLVTRVLPDTDQDHHPILDGHDAAEEYFEEWLRCVERFA